MKKITIFLSFLLCGVMLSSCSAVSHEAPSSLPTPPSQETATSTDDLSSQEDRSEADTASDASIQIQAPNSDQLDSKEKQQLLTESAEEKAREMLSDAAPNLQSDLSLQIKTNSEHFISAFYEGWAEAPDSPHPLLLSYSVNLDTKTMKRVSLNEIARLDDSFATLVADSIRETVEEPQLNYLGNLDTSTLLSRLKLVDTAESKDCSVYENGTLQLYFSVPPIAGDFLPVTNIPLEQWKPYIKDLSYFDNL